MERAESQPAARGHQMIEHTADVIVEAWGPGFAAFCEEAVAGLIELYTERSADPVDTVIVPLSGTTEDDRLAGLLEDVIFLLDTSDLSPVGISVREETASISLSPQVVGTGAVPKAISGLAVQVADGTVRCRFLVDV